MPDYLKYQRSISDELIATKDRVRNFIGDRHWGEDGKYKEIILMNVLKKVLPKSVSLGTGFVICDNGAVSRQIDIIIYRNHIPLLFQQDEFVIVPRESVLGIIEVKTNLSRLAHVERSIRNAHENGKMIGRSMFNGIFSYENEWVFNGKHADSLNIALRQYHGSINNISFGKDYFMKYWDIYQPCPECHSPHYSYYRIRNLSFGYFISNLVEDVYNQENAAPINQTLRNYLYPIIEGKEVNRLDELEIEVPITE